jgi:hypothetical protein
MFATFEVSADDAVSKLTLPVAPFADGVMPFNEIRGYRVAQVVEGRETWSAILDWPGQERDLTIGISIDRHSIAAGDSVRDLFRRCCEIRDSLVRTEALP